jgi:hypothetical protein
MLAAMASVNELRRHVFDDALDLAACVGLVAPLVNLPMGTGMAVSVDPVGFIRRQFTLQMVLLVVRMHEQPREGQTGTTASIQALLDAAALEGRVSQEFRDAYVNVLERMRADYENHGGNFRELRSFRHAELAHSIHRHEQPLDRLLLNPLWDFAHETFDLVASLERHLDQSGLDPMVLKIGSTSGVTREARSEP